MEANKELQEREQQLQMAIRGAELGTWDWNIEKNCIKINDLFASMLGYKLNELEKPEFCFNKWREMVHKDDLENAIKDFDNHVQNKSELYESVFRMKHKNGEWIWILARGKVLEWKNNTPIRALGTHLDITKLKKAEIELQESEEKFRLLFESSLDPILMIDGYNFVECNEATVKMLGLKSHEDIINMRPSKFSPEYQTDGRLSSEKAKEMMDLTYKKGYNRFEWLHTDIKGNAIWMDVALTKIPYKGKEMIFTVWRDISKQKENENNIIKSKKRFSILFEQAADGILVGINGGEIVEANESMVRLTAYKKEELIGNNISVLFDSEELNVKPLRYDLIKKGETVFRERNLIKKNGEIITVEMNTKVLEDGRMQALFRDITKRKKAEIAIKDSEEKYRSLVENIKEFVFVIDKEFKIVSLNVSAQKILGTGEDFLGKSIHEVFPKSISQNYQKNLMEVFDKKKAINKDSIMQLRGRDFYINTSLSPLKNDKGEITGVIGLTRDITVRKLAELALIESEEKYRSIFLNSPLGIIHYDKDGVITDCNEHFVKIIGSSREVLIGLNMTKDLKDKKLKNAIKESLKKKESNYEDWYSSVTANKTTYVRILFKSIKNEENETIAGIGLVEDISQRKIAEENLIESEEKFRLLFESSQDAIFITNNTGFIDCNSQTVRMFRGKSKEDIISKTSIDLSPKYQPDGSKSEEKANFYLDLAFKGKGNTFEWLHSRLDGTTFYAEVSLIPFMIDNNQYLQSIVRDISERKEIEQRILDTITETEEKERQRLASDIHDEIGPLLSSLKIYIESMNENNDATKQKYLKKQLQILVKESIENVREVSNALSPYLLRKYGLKHAIKSFFENSKELIKISFRTNLNEERFSINTETVYFRIIKELLNNTIKHAKAEKVNVSLSYKDEKLTLTYEDDGIGIKKENFKKLEKKGMGLFNITNRILSIQGKYNFFTDQEKGFKFQIIKEVKIIK